MPDDGFRYELIEGMLKKMSPAGAEHGVIIVRLARRLANHVEDNKLGVVLAAETGFRLAQDPDTVRAPDIAFIQSSRIPATGLPKAFWPGAPDLAVEVLSPNEIAEEVEEQINDWLNHGCSMVWVVSPKQKTITVHCSQTDITILSENETLDGRDVVPGFQCSVQDIFTIP
jgi:Uma2 family endonuclease